MPARNDDVPPTGGQRPAAGLLGKALGRVPGVSRRVAEVRRTRPGAGDTAGGPAAGRAAGAARSGARAGGAGQRANRRRAARTAFSPSDAAAASFFTDLDLDGDFDASAVAVVRALIQSRAHLRARTFAQIVQRRPGLEPLGNLCAAVVAVREGMIEMAWTLFGRADRATAIRLAAPEYFRAGLVRDRDGAVETLRALLDAPHSAETDAAGWLNIACTSFVAGADDLSRAALDLADAALPELAASARPRKVAEDIAWLRLWCERAAARGASPTATGEVALAVLGYSSPDRSQSSRDLGEHVQTLATLAHVARQGAVRFTGDPDLVAILDELRTRIPRDRLVPPGDGAGSTPPSVRLVPVDRDATHWSDVPAGTWLIATGSLPNPIFATHVDLPINANLRPIFLGVRVDRPSVLTPEVLDQLRRCGPVGCRDRATVYLLLAADVPAFFSGAVTGTLDLVARRADGGGVLAVDAPARAGATALAQQSEEVHTGGSVENLRAALRYVDAHASATRVVTSRLQSYLTARAVGTRVDFRPPNIADGRLFGLHGQPAAEFDTMRRTLADRLAAVLGVILSGAGEDEVYALWRKLCAEDVASAEARLHDVPPMPPIKFDVAAACASILAKSSTVERTAPAPAGDEINVEFSLDGNYKPQLDVVLDSVVTHASRPIRAFVLCRDHTRADYERLAALFPEVSFVFLPTDDVDYGAISGLLSYTTVATMDRLLLPDLLPGVDRIIHHDLDAMSLVDIAEFYDTDLHGTPIAGRTSPHPSKVSAFEQFIKKAERRKKFPDVGHEYLQRTHAAHAFDFPLLNAGIMLLDLAVMRADDFCTAYIPWVERFGMNDQAVLNVYAGARRIEVAPGWNWRPWLEIMDEPKIAHWAGSYKPWKRPWVVGKGLWREGEARVAARIERAAAHTGPSTG